MKQFFKELWCFFNGHYWWESTTKSIGGRIYYADRKCGCCGEVEILKYDALNLNEALGGRSK